jgi:hypothetical protein
MTNLQWVKATTRMPTEHTVFAKVSHKYEVLYCFGGTFYTDMSYSKKFPDACIDQVQWLDESPSSIEGEEKVQECKSPDGLVVGLIDSLIAISNVLTTDDFLYRDGVWDALADLRASDNMKRLMNIGELEDAKAYIKEKQKEIDVLSTALSELSGQFKKGAITISFIKWLEENCSMEDGIWYYQKYPDNRDNWTDTAALYKMFLSESTSLPIKEEEKTIEWDSERLIGCVHGRFNQLIEKEWDWRSFYGGWMEGRVDIFATIKGLKYPVSENTPKAAPIEQEKKDKL